MTKFNPETYQDIALQKVNEQDASYMPYQLRYIKTDKEESSFELINIQAAHNPFQSKLETLLFFNEKSDYKSSGFVIKNVSPEDAVVLEQKFNNAFSSEPCPGLEEKHLNIFILAQVYHKNDTPQSQRMLDKRFYEAMSANVPIYDFIQWTNLNVLTVAQKKNLEPLDIDLTKPHIINTIEDTRQKFLTSTDNNANKITK